MEPLAELSIESLIEPHLLFPAIAGVVGLALGWILKRRAVTTAERTSDGIELEEAAAEVRDLRKTIYLLQNENRNLSTFLMTLPDLARQLNSNVEKRKIPEVLLAFIEQLFEAEQVLIFLTTPSAREVMLAGGKGFPPGLQGKEVVAFGEGRIGWVAEHRITSDDQEFMQKSRVASAGFVDTLHPVFRPELVAPMASHDQTLGVISVGGLLRRPKNDKNMIKMVADLGSIAMQNTTLFQMIQRSANSDGLTNLANKRHFMTRLAEETLRARKEQRSFSLFLFDIDHFKNYNDTNGHLAGDEALKITARLLKDSVRQDDIPARYGGEEFVVLLPDTDKNGAVVVAEKIRQVVERFAYPHESSQPGGRLTISGGVSTYPYDANTAADLIRCADKALYEGKNAGRNRVCAFKPTYLSEESQEILTRPISEKQEM